MHARGGMPMAITLRARVAKSPRAQAEGNFTRVRVA
jgi:hypothetical protein